MRAGTGCDGKRREGRGGRVASVSGLKTNKIKRSKLQTAETSCHI